MSDYRNRQNRGFESKEAKRAQKPLAKGVPPFHELLMPVKLKQNLHAFAPTSPALPLGKSPLTVPIIKSYLTAPKL